MTEPGATKGENPGWLGFALDFGPLLAFFLAYRFAGGGDAPIQAALIGTATFMIAILIALLISKWRLGRVSPMLWLSAILVIGFGALTLWFRDLRFIQHKPSVIYALFAAVLLIGWARGKPALKYLLQHAYSGLSEAGWLKLSRNWGLFFLGMAVANEIMVATLSQSAWVTAKVWGVTAASLLFAAAQLPMLTRNGLSLGEAEEAAEPPSQG